MELQSPISSPSRHTSTVASTELAAATALPLSAEALDASFAERYRELLEGIPRAEILRRFCEQLAERLAAPLVTLAERAATGAFVIEAASSENGLWLEFQRIQQRWDGGVASQGTAALAASSGEPVRMAIASEALALWRSAAERLRVEEVWALPIATHERLHVLEIFRPAAPACIALPGAASVALLSKGLERLLADMAQFEQNRLLADALRAAGNAAFITDAHACIVWSNAAFTGLTGYAAEEVLGRNPSLLHSGEQGLRYYRELWSTVRSGQAWSGETVDRDKAGNNYTIHQTISPIVSNGRVSHYLSVHEDISRQKRRLQRLERASAADPVTGLLAPAAFEQAARAELEKTAASGARPGLLVISLRGLRKARQLFDDEAEDFIAEEMAQRVRQALPEGCLIGAMRVDEYFALLPSAATMQGSAAALRQQLGEPLLYLGNTLDADVHLGQASFPGDGSNYEALLAHADRQLADEPATRIRHPAGF